MAIVNRTTGPFTQSGKTIMYAGEVATVGFRLFQDDGAGGWEIQSYAGRAFGYRVYRDGGHTLINLSSTIVSDPDGDYASFPLTGALTLSVAVGGYAWEFVEFVTGGRMVIQSGEFEVAIGSPAAQASGSPGAVVAPTTVYDLRTDVGIVNVHYTGQAGRGVPAGGTAGQLPFKVDGTDYNTAWATPLISHISGLQAALDAKATIAALSAHTSDTANPHSVTATQVGLGDVNNTSDANKPVSTAQQAALDLKLNLSGGTLGGHLLFGADGTYDIGSAAANRIRHLYASSLTVSRYKQFYSSGTTLSSYMQSAADGQITLLNAAGTGFTRLNFGGATVTEVALKRSGAGLQVRLGDDSGYAVLSASDLLLKSDTGIITLGASDDVILRRDAADVLALRRSTNTQALRLYGTYADANNYERLSLGYSGGNFRIAAEYGGGGGSPRALMFAAGGSDRWFISGSSGGLFTNADNTVDIGGTSSGRPRDVNIGRNLVVVGTASIGGSATIELMTVGRGANSISTNTAFGRSALASPSLSGGGNVANGYFALNAVTIGAGNIAVGREALIALDIGSYNFAGGYQALYSATAATHSVALGYQALYSVGTVGYNIGIGREALRLNATGIGNIGIGYAADGARTAGNYNIVIGYGINADSTTADNQINIGGVYFHDRIQSAGNVFEFRRGTTAQAARIYNSWASAGADYNRVSLGWSSNIFRLVTEEGGADAASPRQMIIGTSGVASFTVVTSNTTRWNFLSDGRLTPHADATYDIGGGSNQVRDFYLSRYLKIGGAAPAGSSVSAAIQSFGSQWALVASDVLTDATLKRVRIGVAHYTNAQSPFVLFDAQSGSSTNVLAVGGGSGSGVSATEVAFYTAANNTTPTGTRQWRIISTGNLIPSSDGVLDFGSSSTQIRDGHFSRYLRVGGTAPAGTAARLATIQAFGSAWGLIGSDVVTDATTKVLRIAVNHYTASENPLLVFHAFSSASANSINIGGGTSAGHAATEVNVYTGATTTTATGTQRWTWDSSGHYLAAADNTYDFGASGANRVRNVYVGTRVYVGTAVDTTGVTALGLATNGTTRFFLSGSSGHLLANADNTYDIGASGANRPRAIYAAGTATIGGNVFAAGDVRAGASGSIYWNGSSVIRSISDGVLALYNNATTAFTGIKFGGVTASQPYLKVNGANLQGRLADDTDFNRFQAKLQTHANAVAETPTATHTLTLYDAAGTAYRVLCVV